MAETAAALEAPLAAQNDGTVFKQFHEYRWDLDKDFLGGLVLALGGYHALAPTASQADIIMHSRIFYYARIRGLSIPYAPYRDWLREQILLSDTNSNHQPPRIWEWDLLTSLCNHRDRLAASSTTTSFSSSRPPTTNQPEAVAEKDLWTRSLLEDGALRAARAEAAATAPAWMAAAPRGELCVDRDDEKDDEADGQVPYPERFAAIIKAVQTGERIEGILEIPDVVVRNPSTTPFGKMNRPRKPWELAPDGPGTTAEAEHGVANNLDQSFPEQEDGVQQSF